MITDKFETLELENDNYLIRVLNYGATLTDLIYKPLNRNLVKGYSNIKDYYLNETYRGSTVGRVCNRLENGEFRLNDKTYNVFINDKSNSLHGGKVGFSFHLFDFSKTEDTIKCSYLSKDMEEGFPGDLLIIVNYKLLEDGLQITYDLKSNKDTIASICNHSYFNLKGRDSKSLDSTFLKVDADKFALINNEGLSLDKTMNVKGTLFDFRSFKELGPILAAEGFEQKDFASGIDHHFIKKNLEVDDFIDYSCDDLEMMVATSYPGAHIYTANFFEEPQGAICFECQFYPNAINYNDRIKPIIKANENYQFMTTYRFKEKK